MNILIVTGIFPPDAGGPASYVPEIAREFTKLEHRVKVICLSDRTDWDDRKYSFQVIRIPRGLFYPFRSLQIISQVVKCSRRAEVVYVNGLNFEAFLATRITGRPVVSKIVGDSAWERARNRGWFKETIDDYQCANKSVLLRFCDWVRSTPVHHSRRVIVPSLYLGRIVQGWRVAKEKISVVYNAVADHQPSQGSTALPPFDGTTLVTVCRLVPWKGVEELIRLVYALPGFRLVIAGDGPLKDSLVQLASSLGIGNQIVFAGHVPQSEVRFLLLHSDIFVLNSTYEGLPHVVLEAMACKIPVIATNAGGTGELVQDGNTGLLIPPGDFEALKQAVTVLANDPVLRKKIVQGAESYLNQNFSFNRMVTETESIVTHAASRT